MTRREFHTKTYYYLTLLIAFCLPFARLTPVFIALMLLNWLLEGDFKTKLITISKNKFALLFIVFYGMHIAGMIYTENASSGLFDLQVKFSLLIFPLVLASRPFNSKDTEAVFKTFITGCILSSIILLGNALYRYIHLGENCFFYIPFSFLLHPSYLSMYLNTAIAWLLINILQNKFGGQRSSIPATLIILFFSIINILLSSKMGMITMVLIYIGFIIYYIISRKKYTLGIAGIILLLISIFSIIHYVPAIGNRVDNAVNAISNPKLDKSDVESTAVRLLVWQAANQVISENLFLGTGTGDSKDELLKEYEKQGMAGAIENKLNTHNEYYQVLVGIGLIGFVLFLAGLFFPLISAFKTSNTIYICFILIIILNFLSESMLETQAGVMFYAFFNSLLCFMTHSPTKNPQAI